MSELEPPLALRAEPPLQGLPFYAEAIAAGFPSSVLTADAEAIDLNRLLLGRAAACFMLRVRGCSMEGARIFDGDVVIVDRSIPARPGHIVVAELDGAYTLKTLWKQQGRVQLHPAHADFSIIEIGAEMELRLFGVVTWVLRQCGAG